VKLIAGLGNPGESYANTPHNVGFDVADVLARRFEAEWKRSSRFQSLVACATCCGQRLMLAKPQTFMNLSGTSVAPLLMYYGCEPGDLTVSRTTTTCPWQSAHRHPRSGGQPRPGLGDRVPRTMPFPRSAWRGLRPADLCLPRARKFDDAR
jgi:PTH1 family peptidyl-tRNA hydrolase